MTGRNIARYMRLDRLIPEFKDAVDKGTLAMVAAVDLSYLYARKTELQNAADAAALAGARELNQRQSGITAAVDAAIALFAANASDNLIAGATISEANIRFGSCANPDDRLPLRSPNCPFFSSGSIASDSEAAPLSFIEVDTGAASNRPVFFMPVSGGPSTASAASGTPRIEVRLTKSSTDRPDEKRAERAVGSTWLEPPT